MDKNLYIIKGTGLNLDGQVVSVIDQVGDYVIVSPPNSQDDIQNTMVKKACLQPVTNSESYFYRVRITKWKTGSKAGTLEKMEVDIPNAIRNVPIETIVDYLSTNLTPILRME